MTVQRLPWHPFELDRFELTEHGRRALCACGPHFLEVPHLGETRGAGGPHHAVRCPLWRSSIFANEESGR